MQNEQTKAGAESGEMLQSVIDSLGEEDRKRLISGYDLKKFAKVFEDTEMMRSVDALLGNRLNVSAAARALFTHRNTLIYRLKVIKKKTGCDLRNFDEALSFQILRLLYERS